MHKQVQEHNSFYIMAKEHHIVIATQTIQSSCKTCSDVHWFQIFVIVAHVLVLCLHSNNFFYFCMIWNLWQYYLIEVVFSIDGRNLQYIMWCSDWNTIKCWHIAILDEMLWQIYYSVLTTNIYNKTKKYIWKPYQSPFKN